MTGAIEIASGASRARIALRGAELKSWRVGEDDLLWPGDAANWPDSAPILFPVVGWTRDGVRVDGKKYPLGLHGFARHLDFSLVEREDKRALFEARADGATRALFPYDFRLHVEYYLENNKITNTLHVVNEDVRPMPYAAGLHPGFRWPLPGAIGPHVLVFDADESDHVPVIAPGGLFSREKRGISLKGRRLELSHELFSEALCFLDANSQGLEFSCGGKALRMELTDFPHIALWTLPGADFLCLEAWTGHGDPVGFAGELAQKPSMRLLGPGQRACHSACFIWRT